MYSKQKFINYLHLQIDIHRRSSNDKYFCNFSSSLFYPKTLTKDNLSDCGSENELYLRSRTVLIIGLPVMINQIVLFIIILRNYCYYPIEL